MEDQPYPNVIKFFYFFFVTSFKVVTPPAPTGDEFLNFMHCGYSVTHFLPIIEYTVFSQGHSVCISCPLCLLHVDFSLVNVLLSQVFNAFDLLYLLWLNLYCKKIFLVMHHLLCYNNLPYRTHC